MRKTVKQTEKFLWVGVGLRKLHKWTGLDFEDWNVIQNNLHEYMADYIKEIIQKLSGCKELPFPADLVMDMKDHLDVMNRAIGWPRQHDVNWWEYYANINYWILRQGKEESAAQIVERMDAIIWDAKKTRNATIPKVPLLMIPGRAYLFNIDELKERWRGIARDDAARVEEESSELQVEKSELNKANVNSNLFTVANTADFSLFQSP